MSFRGLRSIGAALLGGWALLGCVTPIAYGPMSAESRGFGYSDMRNADGSYTVRVVAGSGAQAHEFWDRRAAELCGGANFRKNIFRAHIPVVTYTGYASGPYGYGGSYTQDAYGAPILEGYLHCEGDAETPTAASEPPAAPAAPSEAQQPPQQQPQPQ